MRRVLNRVIQSGITIWVVITLTFVLIRSLPGGPVAYLRAQLARSGADPGQVDELAEAYFNLNRDAPLFEQYLNYVVSVLQFDLGRSVWYKEPVIEILTEALPWTVFVMSLAFALSFLIGIVLGAVMAYTEGSNFDVSGTVVSLVLNSTPFYVLGLLLIWILAYQQGWFPPTGRYSSGLEPNLSVPFLFDALYHAALPVLSFVLTAAGGIAVTMRGNSISVLGSDYLRVAQLRGLSTRRIASRYVVRNSVLPMYTNMMIAIGFMFGGSVILEQIFAYRGVGYYMFEAIGSRDYPLMMGAFLLITIAVTIGLFIADLTYGLIDPRARSPQESYASGSLIDFLRRWVRKWTSTTPGSETQESETQLSDGGASVFTTRAAEEMRPTRRQSLWARLKNSKAMFLTLWEDSRGKAGVLIVSFYVLMGTVGVVFLAAPEIGQGPRLVQPLQSLDHPLGTNGQGQDMLSLLVHSIPPLFQMILVGSLLATIVATIVGTVSGYVGGLVDRILMLTTDVMIALPGLPLLIVLAAVFQPRHPAAIGLILSINIWAGLARTIRSEVLKLRDISYVESGRIIGDSIPSIIWHGVLPNIMPYVSINFAYNARNIIFSSVALYFLGVLPFSALNWGVIMNTAFNSQALYLESRRFWMIEPMLAIITLTLGVVLLAQSADRIFNPRIRTRHTETDEDGTHTAPAEK
jgi:ABC-type dipeptide/oligopeptide/nickel transport system permease component